MTTRTMQTVYDVRCRVRVRPQNATALAAEKGFGGVLPANAGLAISGGTWTDEAEAMAQAERLAAFDAYVMPLDIPSDLVDQVCDG